MGIVIDVNVFHNVFSGKDNDFTPVLKWILEGKANLVFGGNKQKTELMKMCKYLNFIKELKNLNKVIYFPDDMVDAKEKELLKKVKSKDFDDPHLLALLDVSGVLLICTNDARAFDFIKDTNLYSDKIRRKIYTNFKHNPHLEILSDDNFSNKIKNRTLLPRAVKDKIYQTIGISI